MKTTTESVLIVTDEKGNVVALGRKDMGLQKNLIYRVTDASMTDIGDLLSGGFAQLDTSLEHESS